MISIVLGFRNRESERVENCFSALFKQSYQDFEVIFIDYGSDEHIATKVKSVVCNYSFAKYYYSETRGWFWNRAHALNTGSRFAQGEIILFYDIDIIIEKDFLQKVSELEYHKRFYTFSCFYLPEDFDLTRNLEKNGIHYEQNYVGLCAVKNEAINYIKGFDEYFMVWGCEDDDLYTRLEYLGIERNKQNAVDYLVFHQWHESQAPQKPSLWYLIMVENLFNKSTSVNNQTWGKKIEKIERTLLNTKDEVKVIFTKLTFWEDNPMLYFNPFIQKFHEMKSGDNGIIKITFKAENQQYKNVKWIFRSGKDKKKRVEELSRKDIVEFLQYFIGIHRPTIRDYYFEADENHLIFKCIKN